MCTILLQKKLYFRLLIVFDVPVIMVIIRRIVLSVQWPYLKKKVALESRTLTGSGS